MSSSVSGPASSWRRPSASRAASEEPPQAVGGWSRCRQNRRDNTRDYPLVTGHRRPARWRQAHAIAVATADEKERAGHDRCTLRAGAVLRPASLLAPHRLAGGGGGAGGGVSPPRRQHQRQPVAARNRQPERQRRAQQVISRSGQRDQPDRAARQQREAD